MQLKTPNYMGRAVKLADDCQLQTLVFWWNIFFNINQYSLTG